MMATLDRTAVFVCLGIVALSALCDLVTRRIPNVLTVGGVLLGIVFHAVIGGTEAGAMGAFRGASFALLGAVLCGVIPIMGFIRREMGGGDVKLFMAIGAIAGPSLGFDAQAFTFLFALLVLWPWRLVRAGALRRVVGSGARRLWARLCLRTPPPIEHATVAPVILGPSILIGFLFAVARHGAWL
jgi:prepilin peptidase CpaA